MSRGITQETEKRSKLNFDHSVEITKEAFWLLRGNDDKTWVDYVNRGSNEVSVYHNHGVALFAVTNFLSNVTQYYVQDINA